MWERAEADKLIRLLDSETIVPIKYSDIPEDRLGDIVYYNPVVKQKRNDDGSIKCGVRGTTGGDCLTIPYDNARTASLETVKMLIHSVVSSNKKWRTLLVDIADFYLGTPLPPSRYEYIQQRPHRRHYIHAWLRAEDAYSFSAPFPRQNSSPRPTPGRYIAPI